MFVVSALGLCGAEPKLAKLLNSGGGYVELGDQVVCGALGLAGAGFLVLGCVTRGLAVVVDPVACENQ